jgi:hypothetical protein
MKITREMVLQFIARGQVSMYPLVETGQLSTVCQLEAEGLVEIVHFPDRIDEVRITDRGRAEIANYSDKNCAE